MQISYSFFVIFYQQSTDNGQQSLVNNILIEYLYTNYDIETNTLQLSDSEDFITVATDVILAMINNNFIKMSSVFNLENQKKLIELIVKTQEENEAEIENKENTELEEKIKKDAKDGKDIYEKLIKGYTEKQWGRPCNELPAFIIKRLPVRFTFDNNYFNDLFQGIPIGGYTKIIEKMSG